MTKRIARICFAIGIALAGCGKNKDDKKAAGGSTAATKPAEGKPAGGPLAGGTGVPECDELMAAAQKFVACDKLPAEQKSAYQDMYAKVREGVSTDSADAKQTSAEGCKKALSELAEGAKFRGCAL